MSRIGPDQLRRLALEAIEEAAAASHLGPVPRTRGLALALAWLLHYGREGETLPRWPFESFWQGLSNERTHDRWSAVNAAANAIYLALGDRRDSQRQSLFEQSVSGEGNANSCSERKVKCGMHGGTNAALPSGTGMLGDMDPALDDP